MKLKIACGVTATVEAIVYRLDVPGPDLKRLAGGIRTFSIGGVNTPFGWLKWIAYVLSFVWLRKIRRQRKGRFEA